MSAAGTWVNEYGSIMTLVNEDDRLRGTYQSSTGSTGTYEVLGIQVGCAATPLLGQPLALSICWHAIDDALPDPSWHWGSALCGQISYQNGEEVMVLAHALVASSDFPSVAGVGTYLDKLTYKRVPAPAFDQLLNRHHETAENALVGRWLAAGSSLTLRVDAVRDSRLGLVFGSIVAQSGTHEITGFTDLHASSADLPLQSVTLVAATAGSQVIALSGTLDTLTGCLSVFEMTSAPTAPSSSYCQTQLASTVYNRHPAH
ncbi:avidin/streptavidin family protein [Pseudomonas helleri]|uniref:avidin/streptavidin family protein n=1 Tax=Pseudomonas helleri TaxID=1608996 RepID=UPI003FD431D7